MFWIIALALVFLLYKWSVSNFDYYEKIGVDFAKPVPLFGNMLNIVLHKQSMIDMTRDSYNKFKHSGIFGFFNFKQTTFFVTDPELIKRITIKDFDHFTNHNEAMMNADKVLDRTLFALHNKEWRDMRTTLSPIFTSSKMKMMFELLSLHANDFVDFYEERAKKGERLIVEVLDVFARFTADGISTSALGFQADCVRNKESDIFKIVKKMLHEFAGPYGSFKMLLSFALPKIYSILGLQIMSKEIHDFFRRVVIDTMIERDRKNISRPDVIQLLLLAKKGQFQHDKDQNVNDKELSNFSANIEYDLGKSKTALTQFTDEDWISQGFIFLAGGFDTTSNLLQTISYELSKSPSIQQELYDEIVSVAATLDGKAISYEILHKMNYLDMVVSETLRLWPPAAQTDRSCSKDYDVDLKNGKRITIKKGQIIFLPIYHIHRDPRFFADPEKFDPQRFNNENKDSISSGTYLPFGMGPRTCIGSRFALMEVKLLLFNFLRKFTIEKCEQTPEMLTYQADVNFRIKEKVYLNFKLRK